MSGTGRKSRRTRQEDPEDISETDIKLSMAEKEIETLRKELKALHRRKESSGNHGSDKPTETVKSTADKTAEESLGAAGGLPGKPTDTTSTRDDNIVNDNDDNDRDPVQIQVNDHDDQRDAGQNNPPRGRQQANVPLPRQVVFDGKQPWESFIKPFKAMAAHCRWTEEETLFRLVSSLRDTAAEYTYSVLPNETMNTLPLLEKALEDRFAEKRSKNTYLAELEQRKLGQRETITEYSTDIRRLVIKGYPTADANTREAIELRHFIRGLNDQPMAIAVGMKNPTNIEEAKEAVEIYSSLRDEMGKTSTARVRALQTENQIDAQPTCTGENSSVTQKQLNDLITSMDKRFSGLSRLLKQSPNPRKQDQSGGKSRKDFRCYNCDGEGHMARNCPDRNGNTSQDKSAQQEN